MQCRYKEKIIEAGDMIFGAVYATYRKPGKRRGKYRETSETQAKLNDRKAREKLTWKVHANFNRNDYAVTLTYAEGCYPETEERFDKDVRNYLARLKRIYKKHDKELKYIVIKAFGEGGRCHLHIIVSGGVDRALIENAWEYGRRNTRRLQFNACGIVDLSRYLSDQRHAGKRRWSGSKNLVEPVERTNTTRYARRDLVEIAESANPHKIFADRYPGYWLSEFPEVEKNMFNGGYYMTFVMYKPDSNNLERYARRKS
jgi:hypothetical protein